MADDKNIRFDTFFEELFSKYGATHKLTDIVVTCACPEFVSQEMSSIVFHKFSAEKKIYEYEDINRIVEGDYFDDSFEARVFGLDKQQFILLVYVKSEKIIDDLDKKSISSEININISSLIVKKISDLRDYIVSMSLQTTDISSYCNCPGRAA